MRFGKRDILKDLRVSLSGRTIGLLGPNGAGKSTLIQTLLGFCPLDVGHRQTFSGTTFAPNRSTIRTVVGYMPENDSFIANMTRGFVHPHDGRVVGSAAGRGAGTGA